MADAGAERRVVPGATVTLDGSRSTDVAGGALNYHWALISTPVGSAASLSAADAVRPDFVADIPGEYVAQLIVSDGTSQSRPSTVVISSVQSAPTAVAGRALLASPGADAALDGSASSDPNGDPLAARWSVLALGDQLAGSIVAPTSLTTAFKVPAAGVPLDVAVFNGAASVPVDGEDDGRCDDDCSPRLASVGRISRSGVEYTAWRIRNAADHPVAATLASLDGTFSKDVAVPARSDTYVVSPDVTAPASHEVVVGGLIVARADARADTFADSRLVGGGPALKLSIVQLEVSNALFSSHDDVVVATVEARPTAVASTSGPNYRGMVVTLDGAGSFNPNSTSPANGGLSYSWALLAKPPGSAAVLTNPASPQTTFTPDAYGLYVAQLIVGDGTLSSRPTTLAVLVSPRPPIAVAKSASPVPAGQVVALDGSASTDPDGNPLSYAWTLVSAPAGSSAKIANAAAATASLVPDLAGSYVVQLVASDAYGASAPVTMHIEAQSGIAFSPLPNPETVALGSRLNFTVHAADPKGGAIAYRVIGSLPTGATFNASTGAFSFRPISASPSTFAFAISATNGTDVGAQTIDIQVAGTPVGATAGLSTDVYDAVDYANGKLTPVVGAVVSDSGQSATTGADGGVTLSALPAGQSSVSVSAAGAAPAPDGSKYLDGQVSASLLAGVTNALDAPILLARAGALATVGSGTATVVTDPALAVTLTVAPNSAFNPDGTPYTGAILIGSPPNTTPAGLPVGYQPCQLLVISPAGVTFNPPAQLTVANSDNLPVGSEVDLWAYDPAFTSARVVGVGQVSSDGKTISMQTGGVPSGTVLAMMPRRTNLKTVSTQPAGIFTPSLLGIGDYSTTFSPPGRRDLNSPRGLTFVYHSTTANPVQPLQADAIVPANAGLPLTLQTALTVDGVTQAPSPATSTSVPLNPSTPTLAPANNNVLVQAGIVDASNLPTGVYSYSFLTLSKYACSTVAEPMQGTIVVNNQSNSVIGAGWQIAEVQKLTPQPDGSAVIADGAGRAVVMQPTQVPDFDLSSPVYIPVNGPFRGAVGDFTGDGALSIARLGWKDGTLNVILNEGQRQFAKTSVIPAGNPGVANPDGTFTPDVADMAAGDLTSTGNLDLATMVGHSESAELYFGKGGGVFQSTPLQVEGNDNVDGIVMGNWGDGVMEPLYSENAANNPDFHIMFSWRYLQFNSYPFGPTLPGVTASMVKVRYPGDSFDSVVGESQNGYLSFAYGGHKLQNGSPDYYSDAFPTNILKLPNAPASSLGRVLASADIDGSGRPSFAAIGGASVYIVAWYSKNANDQQITQTLTLPNGLTPDSVTLAPLARGNRPSLIVTAKTAGFYVFTNDGKGNFSPVPTFIATPFRVGYETDVADFDKDGYADIAVNDIDNDRVVIFFGKPHPDGTFVAPIGDYTRLVKNADGTYSRVYKDGTVVTFDGTGLQTAITDANGNKTSYSYNGAGQLTQIVDPTGQVTSMTYAGAFLASTTDPAGRMTSFVHDAAGNLVQVTDPLGNVTQYLYDANHRLVATIDPNGNKTGQTYTATGQLGVQTYPDGASVKMDLSRSLGLDALGVGLNAPSTVAFVPAGARITLLQDANGNKSETEVNEWGAVVRTVDALGRESFFDRDGANNVVQSVIPAGASTGSQAPTASGTPRIASSDSLADTFTYDANGNLTVLYEGITSLGTYRATHYVYENVHAKLIQKTDPLGHVTAWSYDGRGNMLQKTDALGDVTAYTYDAQGLPLTKTDPLGHVTTYAYDADDNLTDTLDAAGTKFDRYYDASGNVILTVDAAGTPVERRRSFTYDADNRALTRTSATGEITSTVYDANGNAIQRTDAAGDVTTANYDGRNRLVSTVDPATGATGFTYDSNGNLITTTDASGAVTTTAYDAANRVISKTDALGAVETSAYDVRNDLSSFANAKGQVTTFSYDRYRRLVSRTRLGNGPGSAYFYDVNDQVTEIIGPDNSLSDVTYDALGRVTGSPWGNYTYDRDGNIIQAGNLNYAYDALDREASVVIPYFVNSGGVTKTLTYDALSRRVGMADSLGGTTAYSYDGEDRLLSLTTPWGGVITQSYDAAGRPLRMGFPNGLDADQSFEAHTGRLASLQYRAGTLASPVASFAQTYDSRGDLASLAEPTQTRTFAHDATHRLVGVARSLPAPAADVESYTYDPAGNRVASDVSAAIAIDGRGEVASDATASYAWDGNGELATRTDAASGAVTNYDWGDGAPPFRRLLRIHGPSYYYGFGHDAFDRLSKIGIAGGEQSQEFRDGPD
ncbi:MAG: VCBS repeat-containing protein, partial [Hyphomicrobiales bacterium]|nr:VCBS repeat-containing protein [Hyphomicrobiales bacterium]